MPVLTYQGAKNLMESRERRHTACRLAKATYLERREGDRFAIKYHATDVITLFPNGNYVLNSGGWHTQTTRFRMMEYAPVHIVQKNNIWYIRGLLYADGMEIAADGNLVTVLESPVSTIKLKSKLDAMVRIYIRSYVAAAIAHGSLEPPSSGDCFMCQFRAEDGTDFGGVDHYFAHFEERYYVPSLLWNAMQCYRDWRVAWQMVDMDVRKGNGRMLQDILRKYFRKLKPSMLEYMREEAKR